MTLLEKAHELGEMIKECPEMKALQDAEKRQEEDVAAQELLKEFNLKRMNLVRDMQSEKITREEAAMKNSQAFS